MDIRVAAYSPITSSQSTAASQQVAPAGLYMPVTPAAPVRAVPSQAQTAKLAANDGYTDSIRGSIINILA